MHRSKFCDGWGENCPSHDHPTIFLCLISNICSCPNANLYPAAPVRCPHPLYKDLKSKVFFFSLWCLWQQYCTIVPNVVSLYPVDDGWQSKLMICSYLSFIFSNYVIVTYAYIWIEVRFALFYLWFSFFSFFFVTYFHWV